MWPIKAPPPPQLGVFNNTGTHFHYYPQNRLNDDVSTWGFKASRAWRTITGTSRRAGQRRGNGWHFEVGRIMTSADYLITRAAMPAAAGERSRAVVRRLTSFHLRSGALFSGVETASRCFGQSTRNEGYRTDGGEERNNKTVLPVMCMGLLRDRLTQRWVSHLNLD